MEWAPRPLGMPKQRWGDIITVVLIHHPDGMEKAIWKGPGERDWFGGPIVIVQGWEVLRLAVESKHFETPYLIQTLWLLPVLLYQHPNLYSCFCLKSPTSYSSKKLLRLLLLLFFGEQFRFTANLRGRYRDFPSVPHTRASSVTNILHQSGTFITTDGPTLEIRNHPKCIGLSLHCCTCCGFG